MVKIHRYSKIWLKDFKYNGVEKELSGADIMPIVEYYNKIGAVYVSTVGGKTIGIGGVYPLWTGAGGCFLFLNKEASKYKKSLFKVFKGYIDVLIKEYGIKTLMVDCLNDKIKAKTLINHLGFKKTNEVKMAFYSKGVDL